MTASPRSLQARLLITVLGLLGAVWTVAVIATWYDTRHELNELLDAHLAQTASLLATQTGDELDDESLSAFPLLHKYQSRVALQVWQEGRLVARSANAPEQPLSSRDTNGLADSEVGGRSWRVFTVRGREHGLLIHVGELHSARRHILLASLRSAIWPMLLALPLLVAAIWWSVRGLLRPLRELGRSVAARRAEALDPLPLAGVPPEVAPMVAALNGLFARMAERLESERRFTADAAHELRTPIAAIRMQAQVAQGAQADTERAQALAATLQGCDRATRLIEQLLLLARLESVEAGEAQSALSTDMVAPVGRVLAELAPAALARGQTLALEAPDALPVGTPVALVDVLARNLVDNALRYSPDGATVRVTLAAGPSASLVVEDSGPGLPPEAMSRLGERFFRVLGTGRSGSGLGWSIVQRIVRAHGLQARVDRSEALGGLRVRLSWPAAA